MIEMQQPPSRMGRYAPLWRRLAYRFLEGFTVLRRVRTANGDFEAFVAANSQLAVLRPNGVRVDATHRRFIQQWVQANSVVWDIGGNVGLFAFPAALRARAGHVYVFEPDAELAANLLRSLRRPRNARLPVTIMPFALSDREGIATFQIAAYGRAMNKLAGVGSWHDHLFVTSETRKVLTLRLDFAADHLLPPDIIKIDVEGAEIMVLEGARETIARYRPVMLLEGPKELQSALKAFFTEHDYVTLDGGHDDFPEVDSPVWGTVATPREKWLAMRSSGVA